MSVEIIEIIRRSDQGVTKPFICRGDDENIYYVKGRGAGHSSLLKEWVAGRLALEMELPIAPFEIVSVPPELAGNNEYYDLAFPEGGWGFGSLKTKRDLQRSRSPIDRLSQKLGGEIL
jgi:hypothetical protein